MSEQAGLWESLLPGALTAAAGVTMAGDITELGNNLNTDMQGMADQSRADSAFKGFGVKTGLGSSTVGTDGSLDVGVGPDMMMRRQGRAGVKGGLDTLGAASQGLMAGQEGALAASQDMMGRSLQDNAARETEIYNRMMAAQQPGMDRARAGMEARSHAQGRGGISGSQYGGSGEQFAQSRAEAEARNSAMLGAMGQSQTEMMNQGQLATQYGQLGQGAAGLMGNIGAQQAGIGQGMYNAQYGDMNQQLQALQLGAGNADMAQTGQLTGVNLGSQLDLGGAQMELNAAKSASELYGNMFGAMTSPMAGLGSMIDDNGGMLTSIGKIFGQEW